MLWSCVKARQDDGGPVLRSRMRRSDIGRPVIDDRPALLKWTCHGAPERCLWIGSNPMPVCARCTGIYLGSVAGIPLGITMWVLGSGPLLVTVIFAGGAMPLAVDGYTQFTGWRRSNNFLRLATGLLAGIGGGAGAVFLALSIFC